MSLLVFVTLSMLSPMSSYPQHENVMTMRISRIYIMSHYPVRLPAAHSHILLQSRPLVSPSLSPSLTPATKMSLLYAGFSSQLWGQTLLTQSWRHTHWAQISFRIPPSTPSGFSPMTRAGIGGKTSPWLTRCSAFLWVHLPSFFPRPLLPFPRG